MNARVWAFTIYSVLFESIVWGLFGWAVFWQGRSAWWFLLAVVVSGAQFKPKDFGIKPADDANDNMVLCNKHLTEQEPSE